MSSQARPKLKLEHIGYKGSADALKDVMGGQVMLFSDVLVPTGPRSEQAGCAASQSPRRRVSMLPDVPTVAEAGLPGMEGAVFFGVMPTGTPPDVVARLNKALQRSPGRAGDEQEAARARLHPAGGSAEAYGARVASETARWRKVIQDAHIPSPG